MDGGDAGRRLNARLVGPTALRPRACRMADPGGLEQAAGPDGPRGLQLSAPNKPSSFIWDSAAAKTVARSSVSLPNLSWRFSLRRGSNSARSSCAARTGRGVELRLADPPRTTLGQSKSRSTWSIERSVRRRCSTISALNSGV